MASIQLKLFASLRESVDLVDSQVAIDAHQPVARLLEDLSREDMRFAQYIAEYPILIAVNQTLVDLDQRLEDGDEVALFPPVTGG